MFTKVLIASGFAALAAAQSSVLGFDHVPNPVTDGQAQAITYHTNDTSSPVTIILKKGPSTDLQNVSTLTTNAHDGQYIWTPSTALANGNDYALYIQQGSVENYNYFGPFQIQGANPSAVASASSHSAAGYGSSTSSSGLSSTTISANGTASTTVPVVTATVGTVGSAAGTGTALPRNTTLSIATLTTPVAPSTSAAGSATNTAASSGAGFQSASSSAPAASSTNAAPGMEISGALSVVFGVAAAAFYLQ